MIAIVPDTGWIEGRFLVVASSFTAHHEWNAFAKRNPTAAQKAWERLSNNPLDRQPRKQYQLRGEYLSCFWELEAAENERIWYSVDEVGFITIVAARDDIASAPQVQRMLSNRYFAYEQAVAHVRDVAMKVTSSTSHVNARTI